MSHPDVLIGYIEEDMLRRDGSIAKWNDDVLSRIPETDDKYPPLIRSMLAVPRADQPLASFRGQRVISVALHQNHFHEHLDRWLPKFEKLLQQLYWIRATLFLNTHYSGDYDLSYDPDQVALNVRALPDAKPSQTWEFRCTWRGTKQPAEHLKGVTGRPGYTTNIQYNKVPDRVRVQRMLDAARTARSTLRGKTREDLDTDEMLFRILVRLYDEIMSDAQRVGDEARRRIPEVRWTYMDRPGRWDDYDWWTVKGDEFWKLNRDELWKLIQDHLTQLISDLKRGTADWPMPDPPRPPASPL